MDCLGWLFPQVSPMCTCGLVAMTSASHAEGRQFDPGQVYLHMRWQRRWPRGGGGAVPNGFCRAEGGGLRAREHARLRPVMHAWAQKQRARKSYK